MLKKNKISDSSQSVSPSVKLNGQNISIVKKPSVPIPKSMLSVPKWALFAIGGVFVFLGIILAAGIIVSQAPRAAQFMENCKGRSCQSGLNLKCINETCVCLKNQYYAKGCFNKRAIGEDCAMNFQCDESKKLSCYNGNCECNDTQYWDKSLGYCTDRKTFGQYCNTDNCLAITKSLRCIDGMCQCDSTRFWNTKVCSLKRNIGDRCFSDTECDDSQLLKCYNGICNCNSTWEYYDEYHRKCLPKLKENEICNRTRQCLGQMQCLTGICSCGINIYFESSNLTCIAQVKLNEPCQKDITCRLDLGLTCQSNQCKCENSTQVWYNDTRGCINYLNYSSLGCFNDTHCKPGLSLFCNLNSLSNKCDCPITSVNGMCDCKRINGNEKYWNGSNCIAAKGEFSTCSYSYECLNPMYCNATSNTCLCPFTQYYDSASYSCINKALNAGTCSSNWNCRQDLGLYCSGGSCTCPTSVQFWHPTNLICTNYYKYSNIGCTLDSHCEPGFSLICNTNPSSNQCYCPTTSIINMCDCKRTTGNEFYWNGTNCVFAKNEFSSCSNSYECLSPMSCTTANKCECPIYMFYDSATYSCKNKLSNGGACNRDQMCRNDQGLYCLGGFCLCDSSKQFWLSSSTSCRNYYNYSETGCTSDSQCRPGLSLFCNTNPTTNACNCPSISQTNMCDCRRTNGNEHYWDGTKCTPALVYDKVCTADYECQTITKGLACNSTYGRCYCMKDWGYYGGKCYTIFAKNGGCSSSCDENDIIPKCPAKYSRSQLAIVSNSGIFNFIKSLDPTSAKTNFKDSYIGGYYKNSGCCARFFGFCIDDCDWEWCTGKSGCNFVWIWVDGSSMATSASTGSWCTGSKSGYYNENSNDFCVVIDPSSGDCFKNDDCSSDRNFICEYSVI